MIAEPTPTSYGLEWQTDAGVIACTVAREGTGIRFETSGPIAAYPTLPIPALAAAHLCDVILSEVRNGHLEAERNERDLAPDDGSDQYA